MTQARTRADQQILSYLATAPKEQTSGAAISKATGLWVSTVYPSLAALENDGLVSGSWEDAPYPRRRFYDLTMAGRAQVGTMPAVQTEARSSLGNRLWQKFIAPFFGG